MNRRVEYIQNTTAREDLFHGRGKMRRDLTKGIAVVVDQATGIAYTGHPFPDIGPAYNEGAFLRSDVEWYVRELDHEWITDRLTSVEATMAARQDLERGFLFWPHGMRR